MSNNVNLIALKAGDVVRMANNSLVKILQNPGDGLWVFGCYVRNADEQAADSVEEPIFAQDIEELLISKN